MADNNVTLPDTSVFDQYRALFSAEQDKRAIEGYQDAFKSLSQNLAADKLNQLGKIANKTSGIATGFITG